MSKMGGSEKIHQGGWPYGECVSMEGGGSNLLHIMAFEHTPVFSYTKPSNASIIYTVGNAKGQI